MLDALFAPQAVAVVGASADQTKLGYIVLDNIIKYGYKGEVHPVNPKADEILRSYTMDLLASLKAEGDCEHLLARGEAFIRKL